MRLRIEKDRPRGILFRVFSDDYNQGEIAYSVIGIRGLQAEIEFPSDWHEYRRAWVRIGLGFARFAFSFPWSKVVPDEHQCSGPTYGFTFFDDGLHLHWGKGKGKRDDPFTIIGMPWRWHHKSKEVLSGPESHSYTYVLRSGEVQHRTATITSDRMTWVRPWLPWKRVRTSIWVDFDAEVGEQTGSWKGGTTGCGFNLLPGETPLQALRRMERERRFER